MDVMIILEVVEQVNPYPYLYFFSKRNRKLTPLRFIYPLTEFMNPHLISCRINERPPPREMRITMKKKGNDEGYEEKDSMISRAQSTPISNFNINDSSTWHNKKLAFLLGNKYTSNCNLIFTLTLTITLNTNT